MLDYVHRFYCYITLRHNWLLGYDPSYSALISIYVFLCLKNIQLDQTHFVIFCFVRFAFVLFCAKRDSWYWQLFDYTSLIYHITWFAKLQMLYLVSFYWWVLLQSIFLIVFKMQMFLLHILTWFSQRTYPHLSYNLQW